MSCFFFFFNDTATTEIYTLSLHDALPISFVAQEYWTIEGEGSHSSQSFPLKLLEYRGQKVEQFSFTNETDRKSTRLNSSHGYISYAVFCLKKKKHTDYTIDQDFLCSTVYR